MRKGEKMVKKIAKKIVICMGILLGFCTFANLVVIKSTDNRITDVDSADTADVVLVLGAKVHPNGSPSQMLRDRLENARQIYRRNKVKKILVSGDSHEPDKYDETKTMKNFLISKGVPVKDIIVDTEGVSTSQSIRRMKEKYKFNSAIISTQKYHLYRSLYLCNRMGIKAQGVPADELDYGNQTLQYCRETFARVKDFIANLYMS